MYAMTLQILSEGYAAHLNSLQGISRPASGNARMFIRRSCFSLPGQHRASSKRSVRKTVSLPQRGSMRENLLKDKENIRINESGVTIVEPGLSTAGTASRARGSSPRVKISPFRYDSSNVWLIKRHIWACFVAPCGRSNDTLRCWVGRESWLRY